MIKNNRQLFFLVVTLSLIGLVVMQIYITDEIFYNTYSGSLPNAMIAKLLHAKHRFGWLNYILMPIFLSLKVCLIYLCFWIGEIFFQKKIAPSHYFRVILVAEMVTICSLYVKIGLVFYHGFDTLTQIDSFQPLSVISLIGISNVSIILSYPLAIFNIFELVYWIVLAVLLSPLLKEKFWNSMKFVAKTYGIGLLIWISLITFITINFLP